MPRKRYHLFRNHGNFFQFEDGIQQYIIECQRKSKAHGGPYTQRYIGSMVSDVHRNLIKGGIFMYPATLKKTGGKLRLLYECNPLAYMVEVAGGKASDGEKRILEKMPAELHERSPLFIGSRLMMEELESCLSKSAGANGKCAL